MKKATRKVVDVVASIRSILGLVTKTKSLSKPELERIETLLKANSSAGQNAEIERLKAALQKERDDKAYWMRAYYEAKKPKQEPNASSFTEILKALRLQLHPDRFADLNAAKERATKAQQIINKALN